METLKKYFLASNSAEGFVPYFDTSYNPFDGWKAYIIKGGPGTGKSTFMKRLVNEAITKGYDPEICPCSSDPDSLDAVVIPKLKMVVMDGTAPHTVDPKYAGAVENILNFGEFWDSDRLGSKTDEIIAVTNKNKALHKIASLYLLTSGNLLKDNISAQQQATNFPKLEGYTKKLCKKYIKETGKKRYENIRFLSGVSPKGMVSFGDTILKYTENLIVFKDNYGGVSHEILKEIRKFALDRNFEIITFKNAFLPQYIDHIVIPELNIAFVTENDYTTFETDARRVHFERFVDVSRLKSKRLKYNKKTFKELLGYATQTLKEAKKVHDDLEKLYIGAMDYDRLNAFCDEFINRVV